MKRNDVLDDALHRTAIIHQAHSLKAFLSASLLEQNLSSFHIKGWEKCHELIAHDELLTSGLLGSAVEVREFDSHRIDGILKRGLFPASYIAMNGWLNTANIEEIFSFYEQQAIKGNEYLLHTVSIFLSFKKLWPSLQEAQIPFAVERFTEFVTSTYYNKNHIEFPKSKFSSNTNVSMENAINKALSQPGFWGHNLICLSWLLQSEKTITTEFKNKVMLFVIEQSEWEFSNEGDKLNQSVFSNIVGSCDRNMFVEKINALIFDSTRNIHQITLSAALVDLWNRFEDENIRKNLFRICCYFSSEY